LATIDGEITSESIADAIVASGTLDTGVMPPLTFSAREHVGTRSVVRVQVEDGKFVPVGDFVSPQ
ncbi:ABC transporter substrate-binding protein, partial [Rhodococcus koreensis]